MHPRESGACRKAGMIDGERGRGKVNQGARQK